MVHRKKSSASSKLRLHSHDRITRREAHVAAEENIDHEIETIWKNIGIYDAFVLATLLKIILDGAQICGYQGYH